MTHFKYNVTYICFMNSWSDGFMDGLLIRFGDDDFVDYAPFNFVSSLYSYESDHDVHLAIFSEESAKEYFLGIGASSVKIVYPFKELELS